MSFTGYIFPRGCFAENVLFFIQSQKCFHLEHNIRVLIIRRVNDVSSHSRSSFYAVAHVRRKIYIFN